MRSAFKDGTDQSDFLVEHINASEHLTRLFGSNIAQVAKKIHADYNAKQLMRYPEKPLEYPSWSDLPNSLKRSNVRQAQSIYDKLHIIGCCVSPIVNHPSDIQHEITDAEIESLARYEHDLWVKERLRNGWVYAPAKNVERKETPYLIPYDELSEEVKELDRDTIKNMPKLLNEIGLGVYRVLI